MLVESCNTVLNAVMCSCLHLVIFAKAAALKISEISELELCYEC